MKLSFKFFLIAFFIGSFSAQLMSMENMKDKAEALEPLIQWKDKIIMRALSQLDQLSHLNDSVLSEQNLTENRRKVIEEQNNCVKIIIKNINEMSEEPTNFYPLKSIHAAYKATSYFITSLEEHPDQEAISNHLEGYYSVLGKLNVINKQINEKTKLSTQSQLGIDDILNEDVIFHDVWNVWTPQVNQHN